MDNVEGKYYALFEQASDPIMVTDFNGNFVNVNTSFCKMFGYDKDELLKMNISQLIEAEEYKERPIRFDLLAEGQHIFSERKMVHKNGTIINVEANVKRFDGTTVMAIARNVTEIRKAHKIIQESEARFRAAFDGSPLGMALLSLDGQWVRVNKELCHIVGYTAEELFNLRFQDITHPDDLKLDIPNYTKLIKGEVDAYRVEKRYIHKNGSSVWIKLNASTIKDYKNVPVYIVAQIEDISLRKNEELYREKISRDLLRQNKDLEQFAYIVSHNLRAPIANIKGLTQLLTDTRVSPEDAAYGLKQLEVSVDRLDNVIIDLNHILQVQREVSERKELVILSTLVEEIKISIQNLVSKEGVQVITDFSAVDKLNTIRSYLYSILYNLISNSIKYRHTDRVPIITIKSELKEDKLRLMYRDNGMGIDMKKFGSQVFGLYKRFHPEVEGKGMGLFMVKSQVETLGGTINVTSELNVGTEFIIEF